MKLGVANAPPSPPRVGGVRIWLVFLRILIIFEVLNFCTGVFLVLFRPKNVWWGKKTVIEKFPYRFRIHFSNGIFTTNCHMVFLNWLFNLHFHLGFPKWFFFKWGLKNIFPTWTGLPKIPTNPPKKIINK